jgi:hypothetical protein
MARLFITEREFDFISDINRELMRDVSGQRIFVYSISETRTRGSKTYDEAVHKVFDDPIEIEALVDVPQWETQNALFSPDQVAKLAVYIHYRDMVERGVQLKVGDYFSYGTIMYEMVNVNPIKPIFGQAEHVDGYVVNGVRARQGTFDQKNLHGPLGEQFTDPGANQDIFVQQRGLAENRFGGTADVHDLQRRGVLEPPLTGQREVSSNGTVSGAAPAFYDE